MYGYFYELEDTKDNHMGLLSVQLFTVIAFMGFTVAYGRYKINIARYMHLPDFKMITITGEIDQTMLLEHSINDGSVEKVMEL